MQVVCTKRQLYALLCEQRVSFKNAMYLDNEEFVVIPKPFGIEFWARPDSGEDDKYLGIIPRDGIDPNIGPIQTVHAWRNKYVK